MADSSSDDELDLLGGPSDLHSLGHPQVTASNGLAPARPRPARRSEGGQTGSAPAPKNLPHKAIEQNHKKRKRRDKNVLDDGDLDAPPKRMRTGTGLDAMPFDVFNEVMKYLSPNDLLRTARVCMAWRASLLARSPQSIWHHVINYSPEAKNLPPRLPGMSEPAYVHLMFEKVCSFCGTGDSQTVAFVLRKRCCIDCFNDRTCFIPIISFGEVLGLDFARRIQPVLVKIQSPRGRRNWLYHEYKSDVYPATDVRAGIAAYKTGDVAFSTFIAQRLVLSRQRQEESKITHDYEAHKLFVYGSAWHEDHLNVCAVRKMEIMERLSSSGYAYEIGFLSSDHYKISSPLNELRSRFDQHEFVIATRPLTERSWTAQRSFLIIFMERFRTQFLSLWKANAIREHFHRLDLLQKDFFMNSLMKDFFVGKGYPVLLTWTDLYEHPRIRALVDAPIKNKIQRMDGYAALKAYLEWKEELRDKGRLETLAALLPQWKSALATINPGSSRRQLATELFKCSRCLGSGMALSLEQAAAHRCEVIRLKWDDPSRQIFSSGVLPWNYEGCFQYSPQAAETAIKLLKIIGCNPETTTTIEMANEVFFCTKCNNKGMNLRAMIVHLMSNPQHAGRVVGMGIAREQEQPVMIIKL